MCLGAIGLCTRKGCGSCVLCMDVPALAPVPCRFCALDGAAHWLRAHQCGPNAIKIHPAGLRGAACWPIRKKRELYTSVTEPLPFSGALSIPPTRGSCVMSVERTGQPCHGIPRQAGDKDGYDGMVISPACMVCILMTVLPRRFYAVWYVDIMIDYAYCMR